MDEEPRRRPLPRPVRCEDCENGVRALRVCRYDPLREWPGVKELGCLYYRERGSGRAERAR